MPLQFLYPSHHRVLVTSTPALLGLAFAHLLRLFACRHRHYHRRSNNIRHRDHPLRRYHRHFLRMKNLDADFYATFGVLASRASKTSYFSWFRTRFRTLLFHGFRRYFFLRFRALLFYGFRHYILVGFFKTSVACSTVASACSTVANLYSMVATPCSTVTYWMQECHHATVEHGNF
jgi:hypothetical protein